MAAERPQSGFKKRVHEVAEFSQKADVVIFMVGGVVYVFNPAVGAIIIIGNTATFIGAELLKRWAMKNKQT